MSAGRRLAWHLRLAWRASRFGIVAAAIGGLALRLLVPVRGWWLSGAVAAASGLLAFLFILAPWPGRRPLPDVADAGAAIEKVGAVDQVAHGLTRAALVLAAFAAGLGLAGLLPLPHQP